MEKDYPIEESETPKVNEPVAEYGISLHKNIRLININEKILDSQLSTLNSFIASSTIRWQSFFEGQTNSQRAKSSLSTS